MGSQLIRLGLMILLLLGSSAQAGDIETGNQQYDEIFNTLYSGSFDEKQQALDLLMQSDIENKKKILQGIASKDLRVHKKSKKVVWVIEQGSKYQINDAFTDQDLGLAGKRKVKKFSINNSLRSYIDSLVSTMDLNAANADTRLQAVEAMLDNPAQEHAALFQQRMQTETDERVIAALQIGIALSQLASKDADSRLAAVNQLVDSLQPAVRNKMKKLADSDADVRVKAAAEKAVKLQEERIRLFGHVETLFFGLSLGSVLVLAAIGLAITFGVMGVINMAHGELIMLGAYTTYIMQMLMPAYPGVALILSIPAAFVVSGLVGIGIERGVIRFLYGRPLETLLATFGISLILQQLVRTVISPQNVPVANPDWMSGFIEINSVLSLTYNRLYILIFCLMVFALLFFILKKTRLGLEVRAVSQNRSMARAMGIRSAWVDAMTFGLGAGIAGVAGVALSQLTNVGPNLGQSYIVDSFMVVVFGGVGNLWGTLIGGMSLGVVNKFMEPWTGAVLAKILVLVFIILFIQKRPRGLFPQKGRAAEG